MTRLLPALLVLATGAATLATQPPTQTSPGDWPYYGSDAASTKFSSLDQIDSTNVDQMRMIWRWRSPDWELFDKEEVVLRRIPNESTPIAIDGALYTSTPLSVVAALDGATGKEIWSFDPEAWRDSTSWGVTRGVAYWSDGDTERIIFGTSSAYLYALDAKTGEPDPDFGTAGRVDLTKGLYRPVDRGSYSVTSPPIICRDVIVVGAFVGDEPDKPLEFTPPGDVRGFDVRTGELLWTFHSAPREGEFGNNTWEDGSWKTAGRNNAWSLMSADHELGYVYLPFGVPNNNFYGGHRPGDNLFGGSIVCLDARTGERIWHFQISHHDIFDYDAPAAPILLDVTIDGKVIKAVAQVTKQAMCFVFDRATGQPLWEIVERQVPQSTVPGERTSPTQPFPTRPAPFDQVGLTEDDLIDFTPELRQEALEIIKQYDYGPLYTPPSERGAIFMPGLIGGADWVGGAVHPGKGWLYVPSHTIPYVPKLTKATDPEALAAYKSIGVPDELDGPRGLPITKPPYGRITAIDLNSGDHAWMKPLGRGPLDHPALSGLNLPPLGNARRYFILLTPTLLMAASEKPNTWDAEYYFDPEAYLVAVDLEDGHSIARVDLPANASGNPMTYMADGRQFVAVSIGFWGERAELVGLAVPRLGEELAPQGYDRKDADHHSFYDAVAAIDAGDTTSLRRLLRETPELVSAHGFLDSTYEHRSLRGATLLHLVAGNTQRQRLPKNALDLAQVLLDAGVDANAMTADSATTIELLLRAQQPRWLGIDDQLLAQLIEAGADISRKNGYLLWMTLTNENASPERKQIFVDSGAPVDLRFAAGLNDVERMRGFFASDSSLTADAATAYRIAPPQPATLDTLTDQQIIDEAFSFAVINNASDAAELLLTRGANIHAMPPRFFWNEDLGRSALHQSVGSCRPDMARFLLEQGSDPDLKEPRWNRSARNWAGNWACDEIKSVFEELDGD